MEYSVDAVAKKVIQIVLFLSVIVALGGLLFYRSAEALPFAIGVGAAAALNIAKVFLQKKTVISAVELSSRSAQLHMQGQYFFRLILTAGVLLVAGYMHANFDARFINLFGVAFGLPTLHVASYAIKFFIKDDPSVSLETSSSGIGSAEDAIRDIQELAADGNQGKA